MSRRKAPNKKVRKTRQGRKSRPSPTPSILKPSNRISKWIAPSLAVASVLLGLLPFLLTKISVANASINNPYGQFTVTNEGTLAITDVSITCKYQPIFDPRENIQIDIQEVTNRVVPYLDAGAAVTALCRLNLVQFGARNHLLRTLIDVDLRCRPAFGLWHKHKSRNFSCPGSPPTTCTAQPVF